MIWGLYVRGGGYQTTSGGLVTHSWAYSLIQPGRMVSVVFRASTLIWPTYLAQTLRPGTSSDVPPVVFHAGLLVFPPALVIPDGAAESQTSYRKIPQDPRSQLTLRRG